MQLSNLNTAWQQLKLLNAMQCIESKDILVLIENSESTEKTRLQTVLFSLVMFITITLFCQGG